MPRSAGGRLGGQPVEADQERRQRLAGAGRARTAACARPTRSPASPASCAGVGPSGKASANHAAVAGENRSVSAAGIPAVSLPSARDRVARRRPAPDPPAAAVERARPRLELRARGRRPGWTLFDAGLGTAEIGRRVDGCAAAARRAGGADRHLPLPHGPHRGEPRPGGADGRRGGDVADRRDPGAPLARPRRGRLDAAPSRGARLPRGGARLGLQRVGRPGRERAPGGADAADRRRRRAGRRRRGVARDPGSRPRRRPDRAARHAHGAAAGGRRDPRPDRAVRRRASGLAPRPARRPARVAGAPRPPRRRDRLSGPLRRRSPTSPAAPPRSASTTPSACARTARCWPTGPPTPTPCRSASTAIGSVRTPAGSPSWSRSRTSCTSSGGARSSGTSARGGRVVFSAR